MILSATSYWFENVKRGCVPSVCHVLAQPHLFLPSGLKPSQISPQKVRPFLIADAW